MANYNYDIKDISLDDFRILIDGYSNIISQSRNIGENRGMDYYIHSYRNFDKNNTSVFSFNESMLLIVIAELLINIKKNEKITGRNAMVEWRYDKINNSIIVKNNCDPELKEFNKKVGVSRGYGLSMINLIFKTLYGVNIERKFINENVFSITLPLKKI